MGCWSRWSIGALLMCAAQGYAEAPRAVSVGGGVTEIVYALQAEAQLVGVDTSSTWPDAAKELPQVGYQRALSAEGVLSLKPQLVLAGHEAGPPAVLQQLRGANLNVVSVNGAYTFDGLQQRVNQVSEALGVVDAGKRLNSQLAEKWRAVQKQLQDQPLRRADGKPLRVAVIISHSNMNMAGGDNSGAAAILALAGLENAFAGKFTEYKPLSAESLALASPDAIVLALTNLNDFDLEHYLAATPSLGLTSGTRNSKIIAVDIVRFLGFGPRLPDVVADLHQQLITP